MSRGHSDGPSVVSEPHRSEHLANSTMARRSPRLSSRLSGGPSVSSGLSSSRYMINPRESMNNDYRSEYSRSSATPSTILDESGQSVPPSFDGSDGEYDPVNITINPSRNAESARVVMREISDKPGMPSYGELWKEKKWLFLGAVKLVLSTCAK